MGDVRVEPVSDRAGLMDFIRFPFQLYAADPNRAPPFVEERLDFFNPQKNLFFVRLIIMGVGTAYRGLGIDALFYVETARAALARGYRRIEAWWLLENNVMMNRIVQRLGGQRYKTDRIYERSLA